ncbi:hypothetical protein VP1G_10341 [Cytospora mali]|nr:hypothetical protein VP1G_10341 [Valsa mali var. pyri (nom. inval.)]
MSQNLRIQAAQASYQKNVIVANSRKPDPSDKFENSPMRNPDFWTEARQAWENGYKAPMSLNPVVIEEQGQQNRVTPELLRQKAGLKSDLVFCDSTYTAPRYGKIEKHHLDKDGIPKEVKYCEVSWDALKAIEEAFECDDNSFIKHPRGCLEVTVVKSLKQKGPGK